MSFFHHKEREVHAQSRRLEDHASNEIMSENNSSTKFQAKKSLTLFVVSSEGHFRNSECTNFM